MTYTYGMCHRGYSIGCQPKGVIVREDDPVAHRYYDIITYNRQLTAEEERQYELVPLITKTDVLYADTETGIALLLLAGYDGYLGTAEEYDELLNMLEGEQK